MGHVKLLARCEYIIGHITNAQFRIDFCFTSYTHLNHLCKNWILYIPLIGRNGTSKLIHIITMQGSDNYVITALVLTKLIATYKPNIFLTTNIRVVITNIGLKYAQKFSATASYANLTTSFETTKVYLMLRKRYVEWSPATYCKFWVNFILMSKKMTINTMVTYWFLHVLSSMENSTLLVFISFSNVFSQLSVPVLLIFTKASVTDLVNSAPKLCGHLQKIVFTF